jgi:hypothetical protein
MRDAKAPPTLVLASAGASLQAERASLTPSSRATRLAALLPLVAPRRPQRVRDQEISLRIGPSAPRTRRAWDAPCQGPRSVDRSRGLGGLAAAGGSEAGARGSRPPPPPRHARHHARYKPTALSRERGDGDAGCARRLELLVLDTQTGGEQAAGRLSTANAYWRPTRIHQAPGPLCSTPAHPSPPLAPPIPTLIPTTAPLTQDSSDSESVVLFWSVFSVFPRAQSERERSSPPQPEKVRLRTPPKTSASECTPTPYAARTPKTRPFAPPLLNWGWPPGRFFVARAGA